jgi:16S rRNA processing protein RimM
MEDVPQTAYRNVATVVRTHGTRGEVVVRSLTDLPFSVPEGAEVFFNPPSLHGIHRAHVASVQQGYPDSRISLEGVDDIAEVSDLVGKTVLAHRSDLPPDEGRDRLVGRAVHCVERGDLGVIDEVFSAGSANLVWTVHGPYGEVLVPVIDEVVLDIPADEESPIEVHLPHGLLDQEADVVDGPAAGEEPSVRGGRP